MHLQNSYIIQSNILLETILPKYIINTWSFITNFISMLSFNEIKMTFAIKNNSFIIIIMILLTMKLHYHYYENKFQ